MVRSRRKSHHLQVWWITIRVSVNNLSVEAKFTQDLSLDENLPITHNVGTGCRYILK
jgi:hypothetical protein